MVVYHEGAQWTFFRNTVGEWQWTRSYQRGSETKVSYHVFRSLQKCLDDAVAHGLPKRLALLVARNEGDDAAGSASHADT
jgi:hypothetical protein